MSADLKITELIETIEANAYVSGQTGQMSSKAHTYLRFREVEGIEFQTRLFAYVLDHALILALSILLWNYISFGYLFFWYVGAKLFYYFLSEFYMQSSFGKRLIKAIVVDEYGNKPSLNAIITRSILRFFPFTIWYTHEQFSETFLISEEELQGLLDLKEKNIRANEDQDSNYKSETVNQYLALDEKEKLPRGITTRNINKHWIDTAIFHGINWELIDWDEEFLEQELLAVNFETTYVIKDNPLDFMSAFKDRHVQEIKLNKEGIVLKETMNKSYPINWEDVLFAKFKHIIPLNKHEHIHYEFHIVLKNNVRYHFVYSYSLSHREFARIFFAFLHNSRQDNSSSI